MTATPELDKRHAVAFEPREPAQVLTEFYDWLQAEGIVLARWGEPYDVTTPCPTCLPDGPGSGVPGVEFRRLRRRHKDVLRIGRSREERSGSHYNGITVGEAQDYAADLCERFPCPDCTAGRGYVYETRVNEERLALHHESPERLFARFFDIDLDKIEDERRALLEALRAAA